MFDNVDGPNHIQRERGRRRSWRTMCELMNFIAQRSRTLNTDVYIPGPVLKHILLPLPPQIASGNIWSIIETNAVAGSVFVFLL